MNGHILAGTNIAVDFWKIQGKRQNLIHFLTHLHGDHIVGLTSSWSKPIYCSEVTALMLRTHYKISPTLLHICPVGESVIVSSSENVVVTAYDANHCPGAVIFFFQGKFGNILYTGDFRSCPSIIENCHYLTTHHQVDLLYIDNTFCDARCIFPSQEECYKEILSTAMQYPNHDIIIGVRKLGKESLLVRLGVDLQETICVTPMCLHIADMLYSTNVFTTKALSNGRCRLRTVPMQEITRKYLEQLNEIHPTIAIIPTAIYTGLNCQPFCCDPNIFIIPYSDHSNYSELMQFVQAVKPRKILPIVTNTRGPFGISISSRADMSCFKAFLLSNQDSPDKTVFHSGMQSMLLTENNFDMDNNIGSWYNEQQYPRISTNQSNPNGFISYPCLSKDSSLAPQRMHKRKQKLSIRTGMKQFKKSPKGVVYENSTSEDSQDTLNPVTNMTSSEAAGMAGYIDICKSLDVEMPEFVDEHENTENSTCDKTSQNINENDVKINTKARTEEMDIQLDLLSRRASTTLFETKCHIKQLGNNRNAPKTIHQEKQNERAMKTGFLETSTGEEWHYLNADSRRKDRPKIKLVCEMHNSLLLSDEKDEQIEDSKLRIQSLNVHGKNFTPDHLVSHDFANCSSKPNFGQENVSNVLNGNNEKSCESLKMISKSTQKVSPCPALTNASKMASLSSLSKDSSKLEMKMVCDSMRKEYTASLEHSDHLLKFGKGTICNTEYKEVDHRPNSFDTKISLSAISTDIIQFEPNPDTSNRKQGSNSFRQSFPLPAVKKCLSAKGGIAIQVYQCQLNNENSLFHDQFSNISPIKKKGDGNVQKTKKGLRFSSVSQRKRIRSSDNREFVNMLKEFTNRK